jgi:hypothetical protein
MALGITRYQPARTSLATRTPVTTRVPSNRVTNTDFNTDPTGGTFDTTEDTSGGSSSGAYSYAAALAKIKADQDAATAAVQRAEKGAEAQRNALLEQIKTAGAIDPTLSKTLEEQKASQEKYIADQLAQQMKQLGESYGTATNLQTQGFDALRNYLQQNAPTAYANAPRAAAPAVSNDIAQYMAAQGVEAQRAEPGLLAARAALEGGATNYNTLLSTLAAQSAAGQESRLAEEQMARQLAAAQLGAYKAQQEGTLTTQQLAALQEIQSQYNTAKFQAQQQAIARKQALEDALNALYGAGYTTPPPVVEEKPTLSPEEAARQAAIRDAINLERGGPSWLRSF